MKYKSLGDSGLKLSAVTFDTWAAGGWMGGGIHKNDAVEAIQAAFNRGITTIDTAPAYGQGLSEKIVGEAIKEIPRDHVQVLTKYGFRPDEEKGKLHSSSTECKDVYQYTSKEGVIKECEASLRRLGTDYIDLYQVNRPDQAIPIEETMDAVLQLKEQGKIREAGVCNYTIDQMKKADEVIDLVSNQVPCSMIRNDAVDEVMPYCKKYNKALIAYNPIQRGLLIGKMDRGYHLYNDGNTGEKEFYLSDEDILKSNNFMREIKSIALANNISLSQLVTQWMVHHTGVTIALVGARNQIQAYQNAAAVDITLTPDEVDFINRRLADLVVERKPAKQPVTIS